MSRSCREPRPRGGMRAIVPLLALALVALLSLGSYPAQELDDRPAVNLNLRDSLALAMDHNLDIAVQRYNIDINESGIDISRAVYESTLTSTFFEDEINNQNANPFAGFPIITSKTRQLTANWNDPTKWGGNFNIFYLGNKQNTNVSLLQPQYATALNFTYTQSLLRNFGLKVNNSPIYIAQNTEKISRSQFEDTVMNTVEQVEFAYWDLVFARLDLQVQRQSLVLAEELLRMNKAKVEVGTMAPIDVTQAEAGVADRVEGVIVAEQAVLNAEDALRQLLNPPPDSPIWISAIIPADSPDFTPINPDIDAAIETAMENRPDLAQQRLAVESNQLQEEIDRKNKRWDLALEARYNLEGLAGRNDGLEEVCVDNRILIVGDPTAPPGATFTTSCEQLATVQVTPGRDTDFLDATRQLNNTEFADWRLQATVTIPIGNKDLKARYAQSRLRHQQSLVQLDQTVLAAEIDVRTRVRNVTTNAKRVDAARVNRRLQEENVDAEQKKFENGMSTSFTVLQVQDALRSAERRENLAIVDYNKSLASLEKAKGTLLEARNIEMSQAAEPVPGLMYEGPLRSVDLQALMNGGGRGD